MNSRSIGFIGGGRVTRILLGGLERAGARPAACVVCDTDSTVLDALRRRFPRSARRPRTAPSRRARISCSVHSTRRR